MNTIIFDGKMLRFNPYNVGDTGESSFKWVDKNKEITDNHLFCKDEKEKVIYPKAKSNDDKFVVGFCNFSKNFPGIGIFKDPEYCDFLCSDSVNYNVTTCRENSNCYSVSTCTPEETIIDNDFRSFFINNFKIEKYIPIRNNWICGGCLFILKNGMNKIYTTDGTIKNCYLCNK